MVSVLIPVYNQFVSLDSVLWHFSRQTTNESFEIIIVDDGSTESDQAVIARYPMLQIRYFANKENYGRAFTRNVAIEHAHGEYLIFCDCDRLPAPDFIDAHLEIIRTNANLLSIGLVTETYENVADLYTAVEKISRRKAIYYRVISSIFDNDGLTDSNLCWLATFSGNMAMNKNMLMKNRFDCDFQVWGFEHFELGYRLWKEQMVFFLNSRAENIHIAHPRATGFYQECIANSYKLFYGKHPNQEIYPLEDFILGRISLQEYEEKICSKAKWLQKKKSPVYVKSLNL
jgi:glycosyltransferase involved in cell wall biosynthesis